MQSTVFQSSLVRGIEESTKSEETRESPNMESTIQSLTDSGCQQYEFGRYESAESEFREALQASQESSLHVAAVLCGNLGATHLQLRNYSRAKLYLQKCLQWKKEGKSATAFDVLMNLGNLTACESLEESVDWYHMAVEELESTQGSEEDWANVLFNLGRLYVQHQQWETARKFLEEAYHWTKEAYGEDHNSMAETFDLLGLVHMAQHHYDEALVAFTRAMAIHRHAKGPFHRNIAQSLLNMGLLRECQGEWSEAWEAYTTAHDLLLRLRTKQNDPLLEMICQSMNTVEVWIARQTRDRMLQRSRSARTQYRAAYASTI
ncbi:hypothetical protein FisN_12Lh052 [Fistulifera solaris]|uniref:Uncharacterized protein n=1 Tax=Fistulifera solaris TaxID=1519565 RepID=A0A1Z5KH22_FISSO|nr:hypothetical protein FisN_12Lh052 [Fistulifera solaris]|eukprot:GAX25517.1 hypothetical protein FisN_12Lh052 [Fistulifera solaris]